MVLTDSEPGSNSSVLLAEGPKSFSSSSMTSREAPFSTMVDPASASRVANKVAKFSLKLIGRARVGVGTLLEQSMARWQRRWSAQILVLEKKLLTFKEATSGKGFTEIIGSDLNFPPISIKLSNR